MKLIKEQLTQKKEPTKRKNSHSRLFICRKITDGKTCYRQEPKSSSNKQNQVKKLTFKKATQTEKRVKNVLRLHQNTFIKVTPLSFITLTIELYNKMT